MGNAFQIKAECLGCRERVAIFNMSYFGKFYLTGPDAQEAADWIFTNNVNLSPGGINNVNLSPGGIYNFCFTCNLRHVSIHVPAYLGYFVGLVSKE